MAGLMFNPTTGGYNTPAQQWAGSTASTFNTPGEGILLNTPSTFASTTPSAQPGWESAVSGLSMPTQNTIPETPQGGGLLPGMTNKPAQPAGYGMAEMMALKQSVDNFSTMQDPSLGAGTRIGSGIGAAIGTGVGFVAGGGPVGAAIGGAIGSAVGSAPGALLDWWANKDALDAAKEEQSMKQQEANALRNYAWARQRKADTEADQTVKDNRFTANFNKMNAIMSLMKQRSDEKLSKQGLLVQRNPVVASTGAGFKAGLQGGMF